MVDRRYHAPDSVSVREVDGELVFLDLDGGQFFVSGGVGPRVWELLTAGNSVEEITKLVSERYGVERSGVRRDVESFVAALLDRGLVSEAEGTSVT